MPADTDAPEDIEARAWVRQRRREATRAGMTRIEARLFAESDLDIGLLRRLVEKGCPPEWIAKVLL